MEHIRSQIDEELLKPRLDKVRLLQILTNLTLQIEKGVNVTVSGDAGPQGVTGEDGREGEQGPRGLRGPEGICKCNITKEAVPKVDEAVAVTPVKKVVAVTPVKEAAVATQVKKTVIKKKVVS